MSVHDVSAPIICGLMRPTAPSTARSRKGIRAAAPESRRTEDLHLHAHDIAPAFHGWRQPAGRWRPHGLRRPRGGGRVATPWAPATSRARATPQATLWAAATPRRPHGLRRLNGRRRDGRRRTTMVAMPMELRQSSPTASHRRRRPSPGAIVSDGRAANRCGKPRKIFQAGQPTMTISPGSLPGPSPHPPGNRSSEDVSSRMELRFPQGTYQGTILQTLADGYLPECPPQVQTDNACHRRRPAQQGPLVRVKSSGKLCKSLSGKVLHGDLSLPKVRAPLTHTLARLMRNPLAHTPDSPEPPRGRPRAMAHAPPMTDDRRGRCRSPSASLAQAERPCPNCR